MRGDPSTRSVSFPFPPKDTPRSAECPDESLLSASVELRGVERELRDLLRGYHRLLSPPNPLRGSVDLFDDALHAETCDRQRRHTPPRFPLSKPPPFPLPEGRGGPQTPHTWETLPAFADSLVGAAVSAVCPAVRRRQAQLKASQHAADASMRRGRRNKRETRPH